MKYLKQLALVAFFICYACAKNADKSIKATTSEIVIEEALIDIPESSDEVIIDKADKSTYINRSLIQQKLNEIVDLQQLSTQDNEFTKEIEQQLQKLIKGKIVIDSTYLNEKISVINYLSPPLQLNDSTKTIGISFNIGSHKQKLSVTIIFSKKVIDGNTYTSQEVSFMTME